MKQYLDLLRHVLQHGVESGDRTGTGTLSVFGTQTRYEMGCGNYATTIPVVTTKKIHWKSVAHELIWMLRGSTNIKYLKENGVTIWDEWADEDGNLGPVYGHQWRSMMCPDGRVIDQIEDVIQQIKTNPNSRRLIVTAWNPVDVPNMKLPPCHMIFQFYVRRGDLSCHMYQRSADLFLGVPFNIASYALLTCIIANICDLRPHELIHTIGDAHIYKNHIDQVKLQLSRTPLPPPILSFKKRFDHVDDVQFDDIVLDDYVFHPSIKAPVAV